MKKIIFIITSLLLSLNCFAQQPSLFSFTPTNSSGTIYGQAEIDGLPASSNDWIAAFDASGNCCGASALTINSGVAYINLVIYGDDGTTPSIDEGMSGSEDFTLRIYQASSLLYIDYPSNTGATYFSGWLNTNGSPIPAYSNVTDLYNFLNISNVTLNLNIQLCENDNPIQLTGGSPLGGNYYGNGVSNNMFDPSIAGSGYHPITYVNNNDSASSMAIVYTLPDASFSIPNNFCENESNILLTSVTSGGYYSGSGVNSNTFNPDVLGNGSYWISYTLTDSNSCEQTEDLLITVYSAPNIPVINQNGINLECTSSGVAYQWLDSNMDSIIGETNSVFTPTSNGIYFVEVSNTNCSEVSEEFVFSLSSISEINDFKVHISKSSITIESVEFVNQILLFDVMGKLVNQSEKSIIDISALPEGIYLLRIIMNNKIIINKINL